MGRWLVGRESQIGPCCKGPRRLRAPWRRIQVKIVLALARCAEGESVEMSCLRMKRKAGDETRQVVTGAPVRRDADGQEPSGTEHTGQVQLTLTTICVAVSSRRRRRASDWEEESHRSGGNRGWLSRHSLTVTGQRAARWSRRCFSSGTLDPTSPPRSPPPYRA